MYPILFELGPIVFPSYITMLCISFIIGSIVWYKFATNDGIKEKHIFALLFIINISAMLGARFHFIVNNLDTYPLSLGLIFNLNTGGFAFYGGFIFALVCSITYVVINRLNIWRIADHIAPTLALGLSITRIGCFLAGCCYGNETSLPWAVRFPPGSPASFEYGVMHHIHPSQLYELIYSLIIFLILVRILKKKQFDGQIFLSFVIFYAIMRSLNEFTRGDIPHNYLFGLTQVQLINIVLVIFAAVIYPFLRMRGEDRATIKG